MAKSLHELEGELWQEINEKLERNPTIGHSLRDGTLYAGISPDTGTKMYAMPRNATLTMTFNLAEDYARSQNRHKARGHDDWRLPTKTELNVLFNNIGESSWGLGSVVTSLWGIVISDLYPEGWYWSGSSHGDGCAWGQRSKDGWQVYFNAGSEANVRLIRTEKLTASQATPKAKP